jgi:pyruvate formate lyase activating enzyme
MHKVEARYYDKLENDYVKCHLCPANCRIGPSRQGICLIRTNEGGVLFASEYGKTIAINNDPIEKKPLYHFRPGSQILSVGPNGCNFGCVFCQNWSISQVKSSTRFVSPKGLVQLANANGSTGVAFTYTEPLVWFEYLMDAARLLRGSGLAVVLVSNGYINEEPARELFRLVDAANFDLKSIRPEFYRKICKGKLTDVQRTIRIAFEMGVHVELTNLLIPGLNDSDDEIRELVDWVAALSPKIPLHFSRYFPHYKIDVPPTQVERLAYAYEIAKIKLKYVYVGNIMGLGDTDTICQKCGNVLVNREGYEIETSGLSGRNCIKCGELSDIAI